ncbi:MAG TPA: methylated-DNA--[protein]-cysteine S-methyltransferase [Candidatus Acidoferrum sp.]|nr:methylated-DNA--[protein]-cysteine S-methyltransferase [Candidatus Acidoferrum sp.]
MNNTLNLLFDRIETPLGNLSLVADQQGNLRFTTWADDKAHLLAMLEQALGGDQFSIAPATDPGGLSAAIASYFAGDLSAIDALPVQTSGTPFQQQVWDKLREIPCGTTISYAELAARIGRPKAVRAVGLANGSNPVGVVVPCHRVIGSNGSLTGYGGGIERKRWLLRHERALENDLGF